jgi:uncharacterized protein (DUF58 family)
MPTRIGLRAILIAGLIIVVARTFAVTEAYALASAILVAVSLGFLSIHLRPVSLVARRWVEPTALHVGDRARLFLEVVNRSRWRNPPVRWVNGGWIPPLRRNSPLVLSEILDTTKRGLLVLPPGQILREDPLGLAARTRVLTPSTEVMVHPRIVDVAMPVAGAGMLGELLLRNAQRLGLGEFDGLRQYADGDDPRSIHWKASARTEDLMVRQFTVEGAKRCTVVLDCDALEAARSGFESFEVAVEIAASLVVAAEACGLATRLVISAGPDLAGPSITGAAITALTHVQPGPAAQPLRRDGSDGLGILVIVTTAAHFPASRARAFTGDLALVPIRVIAGAISTELSPRPEAAPAAVSADPYIEAGDLEQFRLRWNELVGAAR